MSPTPGVHRAFAVSWSGYSRSMATTVMSLEDELDLVRRQLNDLVRDRSTIGLIPSEEHRYRSLCRSERTLLEARSARGATRPGR